MLALLCNLACVFENNELNWVAGILCLFRSSCSVSYLWSLYAKFSFKIDKIVLGNRHGISGTRFHQ